MKRPPMETKLHKGPIRGDKDSIHLKPEDTKKQTVDVHNCRLCVL